MEEKLIHIENELSEEEITKFLPKEMLDELSNGKGEDE
nr:MAG TPA: hypothetical protein [Caudoviricetes sp.]